MGRGSKGGCLLVVWCVTAKLDVTFRGFRGRGLWGAAYEGFDGGDWAWEALGLGVRVNGTLERNG